MTTQPAAFDGGFVSTHERFTANVKRPDYSWSFISARFGEYYGPPKSARKPVGYRTHVQQSCV